MISAFDALQKGKEKREAREAAEARKHAALVAAILARADEAIEHALDEGYTYAEVSLKGLDVTRESGDEARDALSEHGYKVHVAIGRLSIFWGHLRAVEVENE